MGRIASDYGIDPLLSNHKTRPLRQPKHNERVLKQFAISIPHLAPMQWAQNAGFLRVPWTLKRVSKGQSPLAPPPPPPRSAYLPASHRKTSPAKGAAALPPLPPSSTKMLRA